MAVLAVAHLAIRVGLGVGDAAPDLFALAVLFAGRSLRVGHAAVLGFGLGLLQDSFAGRDFGAGALALTSAGAAAAYARQLFVGDSVVFVAAYFFVGKWLLDLVGWAASGGSEWAAFTDRMLLAAPLAALYAAGAGLVLHFVLLRGARTP